MIVNAIVKNKEEDRWVILKKFKIWWLKGLLVKGKVIVKPEGERKWPLGISERIASGKTLGWYAQKQQGGQHCWDRVIRRQKNKE